MIIRQTITINHVWVLVKCTAVVNMGNVVFVHCAAIIGCVFLWFVV